MATIPTVSHGAYPQSSRRTYMSIRAFHNNFFSYTVTKGGPPSFTVTGTLGPVAGANSGNCPAGRTLRENGKKLYPSANPGITTYMVGVYDADSLLSGYIDPNDSVFTVYNTDKPVYIPDGVSPVTSLTDKAPGVNTLGDVRFNGSLVVNTLSNSVIAVITSASTVCDFSTPAYLYKIVLDSTPVTVTVTSFPVAGTILTVQVAATGNNTLTFGAGFNAVTTVAPGANNRSINVTFYSNGTSLSELSRSGIVISY